MNYLSKYKYDPTDMHIRKCRRNDRSLHYDITLSKIAVFITIIYYIGVVMSPENGNNWSVC